MTKLEVFKNEMFGEIRTTTIDDEIWFVGKDVAEALGYSNASKALADHVEEEDKLNNETLSSLGQRGGWLINESGLYSLILGSKLPSAKAFKRWVTHEVIPAIRKHGMYIHGTVDYNEAMCGMLKERIDAQREHIDLLNRQVDDMRRFLDDKQHYIEKAKAFEIMCESDNLMSFRDTAHVLKVPEQDFIEWLIKMRFVYRDGGKKIVPYAKYLKGGLFDVKETIFEYHRGDAGSIKTYAQTFTTVLGRGILSACLEESRRLAAQQKWQGDAETKKLPRGRKEICNG